MKDFFENLGKIVSETTETVGKKTEVLVEVQKLKSQIRTMERANSRDYEDIGKIVFDQFQDGAVIDGECKELCDEIEKREETIKELEVKIADIQGKDQCDVCGSHIDKNAVYCSNCGAKVDKATDDVDVEAEMETEDVKAEEE